MSRFLASAGLVAAASLFGVFGSGCYATVYEEPHYVRHEAVVWVDGPPVEDVAVYPYRDYYGTRVYWVNGFWYYREGARWAYYPTEPQDLYVYRTTYVTTYGPDHHYGHHHHETATVEHSTEYGSGAPEHHTSSVTPAQPPAQPASAPMPVRRVPVSAPAAPAKRAPRKPAPPPAVSEPSRPAPPPAVSEPSRRPAPPPAVSEPSRKPAPLPAAPPKKNPTRKPARIK